MLREGTKNRNSETVTPMAQVSAERQEYVRSYRQNQRDQQNEIGTLPKCVDLELREKLLGSLQLFLEFFEDIFSDPFGEVQIASIRHEEKILVSGVGNLNKLEPRGYGKSTRSILGAVWACLRGSQDFVMVCCDSTEKSTDLLKLALCVLSENEDMLGLFPELWPFHKLNGNSHRCAYQTYKGEKTKISIKGDTIYFPVLGGQYPCEGAMIVARPFKKARGKNVEARRPSVVILDDVQSTEDAMSPTSVNKNVKILTTDIAFLGSRKKPVAIINNATVIQAGDYPSLVSELQAFTTVRYKMVKSFPEEKELWAQYQDIRQSYSSDDPEDRERAAKDALEFYIANRERMDAGAEVTWEYAYSTAKGEISTIQAAMNFIADFGQESFDSECQNDPQDEKGDLDLLSIREIQAKTNNVPENIIPLGQDTVVAMIDVHEEILDFEVWAYDRYFGGSKIKGGTWPDQKRLSFNHANPPIPLSSVYTGLTNVARIDVGLCELFDYLFDREWKGEGGELLSITRCLVDANGTHSDEIKKTLRQSTWKAILTPSYGMGITAKKTPISRLVENKGRTDIGPEWAPTKAKPGQIPGVKFDANHWKTQFHKQLMMPKGERGALMLHAGPEGIHQRSAEGYRAEFPTEVTANGRTIYEWSLKPNHENHPFDCAVGCMVAASMEGVSTVERQKPAKQKISLAAIQRANNGR